MQRPPCKCARPFLCSGVCVEKGGTMKYFLFGAALLLSACASDSDPVGEIQNELAAENREYDWNRNRVCRGGSIISEAKISARPHIVLHDIANDRRSAPTSGSSSVSTCRRFRNVLSIAFGSSSPRHCHKRQRGQNNRVLGLPTVCLGVCLRSPGHSGQQLQGALCCIRQFARGGVLPHR